MKAILGSCQLVVDKPDLVTGKFNGHLANNLLLQAEEAFWAGEKKAEGALKNLVTGPTIVIERKGIDPVEMPNYTRLLITSNEDWIWPTSVEDRRLVIFDVKGKYRTDRKYHGQLRREMFERGGCAKLLHVLMTRAIKKERLFNPPRTKALEEQAIHSMSPEEAWLRDLLESGAMPDGTFVDDAGNAHLLVGPLYESYKGSLPKGRHVKNPQAFGLFLNEHLPKVKGVKYQGESRYFSDNGSGPKQSKKRVVAPLPRCREKYSKRGRAAGQRWPQTDRWRTMADDV